MIEENMAENIDVELVKKAMFKILDDINRATLIYKSRALFEDESSYQLIQDKIVYDRINQLDVQLHDYWYYLARNMIRGTELTDEEVDNLHDYANAIMAIKW